MTHGRTDQANPVIRGRSTEIAGPVEEALLWLEPADLSLLAANFQRIGGLLVVECFSVDFLLEIEWGVGSAVFVDSMRLTPNVAHFFLVPATDALYVSATPIQAFGQVARFSCELSEDVRWWPSVILPTGNGPSQLVIGAGAEIVNPARESGTAVTFHALGAEVVGPATEDGAAVTFHALGADVVSNVVDNAAGIVAGP